MAGDERLKRGPPGSHRGARQAQAEPQPHLCNRVSRAIRARASTHSAKYTQQVREISTIRGMALPRQALLSLCWGLRECLTPSLNCSKKEPHRSYRATGCGTTQKLQGYRLPIGLEHLVGPTGPNADKPRAWNGQ